MHGGMRGNNGNIYKDYFNKWALSYWNYLIFFSSLAFLELQHCAEKNPWWFSLWQFQLIQWEYDEIQFLKISSLLWKKRSIEVILDE